MSAQTELARITVQQFAERFRPEMVPLGSHFSYFYLSMTLNEEELKEYLTEPVAALPPGIVRALPKIGIGLVPYLEKPNGKEKQCLIVLGKPIDARQALDARVDSKADTSLIFPIENREVAEYHYRFYRAISVLVSEHLPQDVQTQYFDLLRAELAGHVHGEVDEDSWRLKQSLVRKSGTAHRETKAFRDYALQSFIDTLTLYLHGICCDIDVDTGPRQLPSRYLRKRLDLLKLIYPPPVDYAVFPEDLKD
jgi:hypothetical protein